MPYISSDNTFVQKNLNYLCNQVSDHGGFIHPDVEILDLSGQSSVKFKKADYHDHIFKIPHSILIPYEDFDFDIENGDLVIAHTRKTADPVHIDLLDKMLETYNESNKFSAHLESAPILRFATKPELIMKLFSAREEPMLDIVANIMSKKDPMQYYDEIAIMSFFKSRLMKCSLNTAGNEGTKVILPVIELMNHNNFGASFKSIYNDEHAFLSTVPKKCEPNNNECFAHYGRLDAMDTFLFYGFVDKSCTFVRSIPLAIDLGDIGQVDVNASHVVIKAHQLDEDNQDLAFYFPNIFINTSLNAAKISHIMIPSSKAAQSMRRILKIAIMNLQPRISEAECADCILKCEKEILKSNLQYYASLNESLKSENKDSFSGMLSSLCDFQIEKISHYKSLHKLG